MKTMERMSQDDIESLQGQTIVRNFTNSLPGSTTLERVTKSAQEEQDASEEQQIETKMRKLFQDDNASDSVFDAVEDAKCRLARVCNDFEAPESPSSLVRARMSRKTAQMKANEAIQGVAAHGFAQLHEYVSTLEATWKSKQGKSGRFFQRFRDVCRILDDHKGVFDIFPSQTGYASVLCGGISLIVRAAVNHDEIADDISDAITTVTEKAARASNILLVLRTRAMHRLLSELYAQVLLFYRDVIEWYKKSRTSRFLASFDESLGERYRKAKDKIEDMLNEMYRENNIANTARVKWFCTETERRDEVLRQRQQNPTHNVTRPGQLAHIMLLSSFRMRCIEAQARTRSGRSAQQDTVISYKEVRKDASGISRTGARDFAVGLQAHIVGNEGYSLLNDGRFWLPGADIGCKLRAWFDPEVISMTLWISSDNVLQSDRPGSYAAALNMLIVAWEAEMPMISHFCERPRFATLGTDRDVEKVGLIGLVYSLTSQLLQFKFDKDNFEVSEDALRGLDGSDESWPAALGLFSALLAATPHLSICVIDSLNDLAFGAGAQWCDAFLRVLFEHQKSSAGIFRILLTTTGQSRVLQDHVKISDRVFTQTEAQEVIRSGRWYTSPEN